MDCAVSPSVAVVEPRVPYIVRTPPSILVFNHHFPVQIVTPSSRLPLHATNRALDDLGRSTRLSVPGCFARYSGVGIFGLSAGGAILAE